MKGLELCENYFEEVVSKIISNVAPTIQDQYAAGLIGYGSDVLGHDDEFSKDHEWGPRCTIWLKDEDYIIYSKKLNEAFNELLPKTYQGYSTRFIEDPEIGCLIPTDEEHGMHHIAISTVSRNIKLQYGLDYFEPNLLDWLCIPEQKLLELTRGRIFRDPIGEITEIRSKLNYYPDEVWHFKFAYTWEQLNNYDDLGLSIARGDYLSARLILNKLVYHIMRLAFLLNRRYSPGTMKWFSREFFNLSVEEIGQMVEKVLVMELEKAKIQIEEILFILVNSMRDMNITREFRLLTSGYSRGHAKYLFTDLIEALREQLSSDLLKLEISGTIDQWVTNDDILIGADDFMKFKEIYTKKNRETRSNIGDRMV